MLDIWVDIITLEILNMARDGYGLDTILHNDYVAEIKKKTKDNVLCFLAEHDAEIRKQTIEEFLDLLINHPSTSTFDWEYYQEIAKKMKGETDGEYDC